jgi:hypothetical protein
VLALLLVCEETPALSALDGADRVLEDQPSINGDLSFARRQAVAAAHVTFHLSPPCWFRTS